MEFLMAAFTLIFETIFDYTIGTIGRQIGYSIHYQKNVDNLQMKAMELEVARHSVEKIEDNVQMWLTDVERITAKLGKFFEDEGQAQMKCCNWKFPNLKARYQLSKRADKLGLEVKEIMEKGKFSKIGSRAPKIGTTISTKDYENFESRIEIFEGIMKALKDDNIRAIGVCGMGGTGKTMLVAKVATQAIEEKLFEKVVTIVVSQTPKFKKIQEEIAKELSLHFQKKDVDSRRAELLRERLKQENKIVIIIDDIWRKLDLEALGISFEDDKKGCKILLTSRSRDVLGRDMGAQRIFHVGILLNNEPTYLFKKIVGDIVETSDFQSIAVEVIEECGGLPIAITAVAHALKSETDPKVCKDALRQLKTANPIDIEGMHEMVYRSIRLSYDVLSKEAKSLFLFCSILGEDMDIPIELLETLLVGSDFLEDVSTIEEVRNRVYTLVKELKASSLLLEGEESDTIKVHDVIRDVAIYIADKGKRMLSIRSSDDLKKWLNSKVLEDSIIMTLLEIDFSEFPERLECPQVKFIFLANQKGPLQIPNTFFEGVKNLKVLLLCEIRLTKLPSSLLVLDNLQSLYLIECELEDIAMIGELRNLKILCLSDSNIRQLPKEIERLTQLKLLNLEDCSELEVIPPNVLSNLKKLEELYMKRSFNKWEIEEPSMERRNAKISDLDHLSHLTTLQIEIPNAKILPKVLFLEKLERYEILIGNNWDWDWDIYSEHEPEISRKLKLCLDRSFQVEADVEKLLKSCECLYLGKMEGVNRIIYKDLPKLKYLNMTGNAGIQYITSWMGVQRVAFPLLESISLKDLINLEKICHSQLAVGSFSNLRKIEVCDCNSLRFMFSSSVVGYFSKLQEIDIRRCTGMTAIVAKEGEEEIEINDITANIMEFPQLRCFHIEDLPNLMGFCSGVDSHSLFNEKVGFPKCFCPRKQTSKWPSLKTLKIYGCPKVEIVSSDDLSCRDTNGMGHHHVPIQRSLFLIDKKLKKYYQPRLLSLGPIHHGKENYQLGEKYKLIWTSEFSNGCRKTMDDLYNKIEKKIEDLRYCYEEEVTKKYDDKALTWLLFVDGCAILQFIYCAINKRKSKLDLKNNSVAFVHRDLFLFENQLPYSLLKLLNENERELMNSIKTYIQSQVMVPEGNSKEDEEPIHLLDLLRTSLLGEPHEDSVSMRNRKSDQHQISHRNVQELKEAGIYLRRSSNSCLRDISFSQSLNLLGHLYIPPITLNNLTRPMILNLVTYEKCHNFKNDFGVTSYIAFLRSLIKEAKDVRELRKAGIFYNLIGSDEEVANLFKEMANLFNEMPFIPTNIGVEERIEEYYGTMLSQMFRIYHGNFNCTSWGIFKLLVIVLGLSCIKYTTRMYPFIDAYFSIYVLLALSLCLLIQRVLS